MAADALTELQRKQKRWAALEIERTSWFSHWQELARYLLPRSGRFLASDRNRGEKRHNAIYDSTGTRALRVLAAGLMAGMTSPARPWFRVTTPYDDLNEEESVKLWLDNVTRRMRDVFSHSNTYRALHSIYEELGAYGSASCFILEDYEHVIHCTPLTIGEYAFATDGKGNVSSLFRKFDMSADQLVQEFGRDKVSLRVGEAYDLGRGLDYWVPVMHVVEPRKGGYDARIPGAQNMPFESCYFEMQANNGKYLRESGFKRLPAVCPRWKVTSTDIYGESPGMEALGDVKQLQHQQLRKGQGIDQYTQPALQAPTSMKGTPIQSQPGGFTYGDAAANQGVRTLWDMKLNLQHLLEDIQDVRSRINDTFYVPLFLMLANEERAEITAREIAERHEEKLLMLGPVLERLHNELLSPLIDITFDRMLEAGMLPPAPPELQGKELKIEFVSMLAQAQQAVGLASVDRLLGTVGSAAAMGMTSMLDKLDGDQIVDEYAQMLGVSPTLILADDKVAIIREQKAAQAAAMAQAEQAPAAAQTAKTLSETDTQKPSALSDAINMFSGYSGV